MALISFSSSETNLFHLGNNIIEMESTWGLGQMNTKSKPTINQKQKTRKRRKAIPPKLQSLKINNFSDYHEQLLIKFREFTTSQACKTFKQALLTLVGRHTPVKYREDYSFKQQWEVTNQKNYEDGYDISTASTWISIFRMLMFALCMWGLSIVVFFPAHDNLWVRILLAIISFLEGLKYAINFRHTVPSEKISEFIKQSASIAYSLLVLIFPQLLEMTSWISRLIATLLIIHMYVKLSKIYISIKNYHISSQYRDIVNLFDLFVLLITITHIFGCVLFITAELSSEGEKNWVKKADLDDTSWGEKYIYSLYFSATTLLTVGYGDIAPTNVKEVAAILVTEFIGIAIFGYAVNKIGAALSNMQEKSQKLQKDLGTVENFGKSCRLEPNVVCKMRTQVINNKRLDEDLCLKDQHQLLQNFSQDLREKIQIQSGLQVIKNSIFMIVNWTGKFQSKVAEKLVKQVYKAEEVLPQSIGKEKLYILDKGRIQILNCSKAVFQKVLKQFQVTGNDEVIMQNVYGYSAIMSSRPINLNAIAKQTSICYTLTKADFIEILDECEVDREHFHQIKSKIDYARIPEMIETPSIVNIRQHYIPSLIHIISKYKRRKQPQNNRYRFQRNKKRSKLYIKSDQFKETIQKQDQSLMQSKSARELRISKIETLSYFALSASFECGFECFKMFEKYFKKSNIENVLMRMRMTKVNKKPIKKK